VSTNTLETPIAIIDADEFERNLGLMAQFANARGIRLRPHAKSHKCSEIARRQLALGAVGVCCQTVGEAVAMVKGGIGDVLITNMVVTPSKLATIAELARRARVGLLFDDAEQVKRAGAVFAGYDARVDAYIEIEAGGERCGVESPSAAVALAGTIAQQPSLRFMGLQAYHGKAQHMRSRAERLDAARQAGETASAVKAALAEAGFTCERITGAGTGSFAADAEIGVLNEWQCGSYAFMDRDYGENEPNDPAFEHSLFIAATVISLREGFAVIDAGLKALAFDSGLPAVAERPDLSYFGPNDEHGRIDVSRASTPLKIGDQVHLIPGHCDPTLALHDEIALMRQGRIEAMWKVDGRGPR
jgi:D-serine deaminase-like pyridoxal phosphate-dependent protein